MLHGEGLWSRETSSVGTRRGGRRVQGKGALSPEHRGTKADKAGVSGWILPATVRTQDGGDSPTSNVTRGTSVTRP